MFALFGRSLLFPAPFRSCCGLKEQRDRKKLPWRSVSGQDSHPMTSAHMADDNSTLRAAWLAHKHTRGSPPKAVPSRFESDAVISYVPTGLIYRGHREIEVLLDQMRNSYQCIEETEVLSTIYGQNDVFEESILTIRHERSIEYLLPGIKETGRTLKCAMCTVSTFKDDKLAYQRVYWDHASLLQQAGVLPPSVRGKTATSPQIVLKVAGTKVEDVIKAALPKEGAEPNAAKVQQEQQSAAATQATSDEDRPLQNNGHKNAAADHFDEQPVGATAQKQAITKEYVTPDPAVAVANRNNPVTGSRQSVKLHAPPGGVSQFSLGGDAPVSNARAAQQQPTPALTEDTEATANFAARNTYAARNRGSFAFDSSSPTPSTTTTTEDPALTANNAARNTYAARNRGSFGFGDDSTPSSVTTNQQQQPRSTGRTHYAPAESKIGAPPVTGSKVPSVKLHAPPGGQSQITFG
ncbi:uncharacterized protein EV422DRAFT_508031 [Fimicolochytrium jonesii]|uniref:uncharacterized protein n=1 Tax=Fimicolochytrium jonesii TaxID=1396493 RepID=UPI0022FE2992|nr:uncharacterized protein EV422DRAFT_508031 [Fimicolochytrium jonesii]KAI8818495.1 hypothetical protein EV422DRAFT_508031 [Fimicolochytrium jonesii]